MIILNESPINPDQNPKIKYRIPISLWLVEKSHFSNFVITNSFKTLNSLKLFLLVKYFTFFGPFVLKKIIELRIETNLACAGLNSNHVRF